jgi:malonyl CoA-acyl carrier protein transacylase
MTTQELAAIARRRLTLVHAVPEESAEEHLRNALFILHNIEADAPATCAFVPEIGRAERRAQAALELLAAPQLASAHIRQSLEALIEAPVDWDDTITDLRAVAARLLKALFALDEGVA